MVRLDAPKRSVTGTRNWPTSDAQVPRLNVHCMHIANIRHADSIVTNAVGADVRPVLPAMPSRPAVNDR
jgi:hypothetical protein